MGEENSKNIGDFTFDNYNEKNYDKDKETAMELMCRHFEFYGQLNSPDIEYATRGAKLSCTHGNKYIYLDAVKDHGVYDGDHPVLTCKDCKVNENIYDFGACGNGKFEPLYSEDAPHPAETALNQKGEKRYVCRPILLGGWGYGDINSRSLLIGEVNMDKEYKVYKKESANDGKPSEYISHCINTIESQNETKNPIDAMQNREEILEEYVEALMTCDNLVCLYGGVITIVENSETEEIVNEDNLNTGEVKKEEIEFILEDNWLKLYLSPTVSEKGRSVPKHPDAANWDWAMEEELHDDKKNLDWFEKSSPAQKYITQKGGKFDANRLENGLYVDGEGRYWVAVGPNVVNPGHSKEKQDNRIDISAIFPGTKIDIKVQCGKEGEHDGEIFYIPAVVGDAKEHSYPDGMYQTGDPFYKKLPKIPGNSNSVEFIGYDIEQKVYEEGQEPKSCVNVTNNYKIIEIIVYDGVFNYE